jgi:hypothetical protein
MNEILSYDEIQRRYDSEWVLIAYTEMDDDFEVVAGEVIAHSSIEQEIYKLLPLGRGRNVSIEYIGKVSYIPTAHFSPGVQGPTTASPSFSFSATSKFNASSFSRRSSVLLKLCR